MEKTREPAVAVRPLEWWWYCNDQVTIFQASYGGLYQIRIRCGVVWVDWPDRPATEFATIEAAKAAAQADYEGRIRSALLPAPTSEAVAEAQMSRDERQAAWAALRMVADAVGELFGPAASIESEDASLLRGPEYHHFAAGVVEALQRVRQKLEEEQEAHRLTRVAEFAKVSYRDKRHAQMETRLAALEAEVTGLRVNLANAADINATLRQKLGEAGQIGVACAIKSGQNEHRAKIAERRLATVEAESARLRAAMKQKED